MTDVKKLISGFLVLAAIVGSSALVLPVLFPGRKQAQTEPSASKSGELAAEVSPAIPSNAFVEKLPANTAGLRPRNIRLSDDSGLPPLVPTDNLTEDLAQRLTRGVIQSNPDGPVNLGGELSLTAPNVDDFVSGSVRKNLSADLPDFDDPLRGINLKISEAGNDATTEYFQKLDEILKDTIVGKDYETLAASEPGLETLDGWQTIYGEAARRLQNLPVPQELLAFHRSLLSLVINRKRFFDIPSGHPEDPLLALAATDAARGKIDDVITRDAEKFGEELNVVNSALSRFQRKSGGEKNTLFAFAESAFFIPKAEALIFVPIEFAGPIAVANSTANTKSAAQKFYEWLQKYLKNQLQNQLLNLIQKQIVGWIQGKGNPKFITNWRGFVGDIYNQAAGAAIQESIPGICSSFQPLVKVTLTSIYLPGGAGGGCTLDRVVTHIKDFYGDFSNGGWIAYGETLRPNGNFFGAFIEASDQVAVKSAEAAKSAENTGLAGGGFLGQLYCPVSKTEADQGKCPGWCPDSKVVTDTGTCPGFPDEQPVAQSPITRTPGQVAGAAVADVVGAPIKRVVNADRLETLVGAVVDAAINRIISEGAAGLAGISYKKKAPAGEYGSVKEPSATSTLREEFP